MIYDPTNTVTALNQVNRQCQQTQLTKTPLYPHRTLWCYTNAVLLLKPKVKNVKIVLNIYSTMRTDREVLGRQEAGQSKIKARPSQLTCKNCSYHCAPL